MARPGANKMALGVGIALTTLWMLFSGWEAVPPEPTIGIHHPPQRTIPKTEATLRTTIPPPEPGTSRALTRPRLGIEPLVETSCVSDKATTENTPHPLSSVTLSASTLDDINESKMYPKLSSVGKCSNDRFLIVNTHTYGRHHNQLQEIMNTIVWAHKLGRTAVLGWFRYDHQWVDPRTFYDFTEIHKRYCVIFHDELPSAIQAATPKGQLFSSRCLGQGYADTPLKRMLGKLISPCKKGSMTIPAHYTTRFGTNTSQVFFNEHVVPSKEGLLVVCGQLGFFMRVGVAEAAATFKWLRPSPKVKAALAEQEEKVFSSGRVSFGVHSRSREKECIKEQGFDKVDGASLQTLTQAHWASLEAQCKLTVPHINVVLESTCLSKGVQIVLASDGQNPDFERALLMDKGAKKTSPLPDLLGLAVDYFILTQCNLFTGNQLSSVTQNVLYHRLGNGLPSNGVVPEYLLYHARPLTITPQQE